MANVFQSKEGNCSLLQKNVGENQHSHLYSDYRCSRRRIFTPITGAVVSVRKENITKHRRGPKVTLVRRDLRDQETTGC